MTACLIVIAGLLAILVALAVATLVSRRRQTIVGRTVTVNTRKPDDQSIRGVLLHDRSDRLTLVQAEYLAGSVEQPVGGLVHVPRENVAWLQEH